MRVIAGTYRSRPLTAPRGMDTRPTSDRLRETLFNVLAPRIEGAVFIDLFAGSGAVGIEALSRGAVETVFVEKAEPAVQAIRKNLATLGIRSSYVLETRSVAASLKRIAGAGRQADIVFLDPPYAAQEEYERTLGLLGGECAGLLSTDAIVIAEHEKKHALAESYDLLRAYRVLRQGDAALSFFRLENTANKNPGATESDTETGL
ncbi:16S rRNA (guanine(966)-N(2))-methyltransferase RsmD [Silvibacterium dinghuense]|uniref:16S rRNA (Guanine(966)-N(2))-methyltransferase RsmD n=1 Tax=Silvibacterium dinghuense TaxID=1560006 RepID=A0A4Q1SJT6_9BACT|nr:16S rRNA (guanine(966)-N(2))-methyltransferase RsmD [Silvibacterium dinghuense]RXS97707.1 16S rRNA (guanine(966)-N(2))-methyltransferase RsmD [Silvibacterium dinghuense]GGH01325.1 methyltransferase [Silvibacterium dinghuense]